MIKRKDSQKIRNGLSTRLLQTSIGDDDHLISSGLMPPI